MLGNKSAPWPNNRFKIARIILAALCLIVEIGSETARALPANLVKDINAISAEHNVMFGKIVAIGNTTFFVADDDAGGELWKSDGTAAGTKMVKDICPGPDGSDPLYYSVASVNGKLFFWADDGVHGYELWSSDGTSAGTVLVKDINPGADGSFGLYPFEPAVIAGIFYFWANDGVHGYELWRSDGTAAGTALVKDVAPGAADANPGGYWSIMNVNGTLFFKTSGEDGGALWKSNGTAAGTAEVVISSGSFNQSSELTAHGGDCFFTVQGTDYSTQLWKCSAATGKAVQLKSFVPGWGIWSMASVGGKLFFAAGKTTGGQLWKSDGTASGTVIVKDLKIPFMAYDSFAMQPFDMTANVNGTLFFWADDGTNGVELWKSNGTEAGTVIVKNIVSGKGSSDPAHLLNIGGTLFFNGDDGVSGEELWKSDGTAAGTVMVKNIFSGAGDSNPTWLANLNGTLIFRAADGVHGKGVWKSDGTAAGTTLVKYITYTSADSSPNDLAGASGTLFFAADDGTHGEEIWISKGTSAGTTMLKDICAGADGSEPFGLTDVNGKIFFSAYDDDHGEELWKTDGTAAGTVMVKDIAPGTEDSFPSNLTNVNGTLFFTAHDGEHGEELWKSNGTAAGTVMVKDILAGSDTGFLGVFYPSFTNVNGTLFFLANDRDHGAELWKSNGTAAGTVMVKDIQPGYGGSFSNRDIPWRNANGVLYFVADDGEHGWELWKSNGTDAGTTLVKDIRPGSIGAMDIHSSTILFESGSPERIMENIGGTLYFNANDGVHGRELWKTDGSLAGTVMVKDIWPDAGGSEPYGLKNIGGILYFSAVDVSHGRELWKSNGTAAGTVLVKDMMPGAIGSIPDEIVAADRPGEFFFQAHQAASGTELWKSDGTASGTAQVQDINSGSASSYPEELTVTGSRLYFNARDKTYGSELWTIPLRSNNVEEFLGYH